jgi:hypothetical protein
MLKRLESLDHRVRLMSQIEVWLKAQELKEIFRAHITIQIAQMLIEAL